MARVIRLLTATSLTGFLCLAAQTAHAQTPPAATDTGSTAAPAPGAAAPSSDSIEKARVHYERGLVLFNEENYDAALFEFERAYELAPSYKILYNMGRIQRQQNNYAAALRSYSRYLREGGTAIPPERRAEVEKELSTLKPRVAEVTIKVNVDGANVYSDDVPVCAATIESSCIGISPLREPIVVNGGRHKFTATKKGYSTATALISVVGSDSTEVKLELVDIRPKPVAKANPWTVPTIVGWAATGVTLIGGGVLGGLALSAKDDQEAMLNRPGVTKTGLHDARTKTQTLATAGDVLFVTGAVFAAASAYLTIKMIGFKRHEAAPSTIGPAPQAATLDLRVGPTGLGAVGTF
jgi:hypothetical protein